MRKRRLGRTDIVVNPLGFGGARIGFEHASQTEVDRIMDTLLDVDCIFVDTASSYAGSEALIGNAIKGRRDRFVLATKTPNVPGDGTGLNWSGKSIEQAIDSSLSNLRTDYLDVVHLHGASFKTLMDGDAVNAIQKAQKSGKCKYIGFSGDGSAAMAAIKLEVFDTLQTSFNLVDQKACTEILPVARAAELGIIAKRPLANGTFGKTRSPYEYADEYFERTRDIRVPAGGPLDPYELSLRFALSNSMIDICIVGTTCADHIVDNARSMAKGKLSDEIIASLVQQFAELGKEWEPLN
tara:strand:- start:1064 stop:1951 length:888 start_codon:yes stop_codon:yes gene_type:complete